MEIYKNLSLEDLSNEIWKDIPGYEGFYQISNMGRVKGLERTIVYKNNYVHKYESKVKKQKITEDGYLRVGLNKSNNQKWITVHRLVALAFIPNPNNKETVNHINENKKDNRVENLEWMTRIENQSYGTARERATKSKSKKVLQLTTNGELVKEWSSAVEAEKTGKFSNSHICSCCKGRRKTHKGYIWKYKEEK